MRSHFLFIFIHFAVCLNYASKAVLAGGAVTLTSLDAMRAYSNHYKVPYLTASVSKRDIGLEMRPRGNDFFISVRPSLVPVLVDLVQYFKWKSFGYIYDDNVGKYRDINKIMERDHMCVYKLRTGFYYSFITVHQNH